MNNDIKTDAMRILYKYGVEDDGSLTESYKEIKALFRTATLDEVNNRLAEIKKHAKETYGLDESVGVDMSINAVDNLKSKR